MIKKTLLILLAVHFILNVYSQNNKPEYKVANWQGFTKAAITFTFDDNTTGQFDIAIPMFNKYNFCATFYPVVNWSPNWQLFANAVNNGHEIGSHTMSHPNLATITDSAAVAELILSYKNLVNRFNKSSYSFAYPYCIPPVNTDTLKKYYIAARHCQGNIEKTTPNDFYNISSITCGTKGSINTVNDFIQIKNQAVNMSGWAVLLLHGINNDGGYSPIESDVLQATLEYYNTIRDSVWVTTFIDAVKYIRERNCLNINELSVVNDTIVVNITDTLDNNIYNLPVTISRQLPQNWRFAGAIQNNLKIKTRVTKTNNTGFIEFDAVPDAGTVKIYNIKQ